LIYPSLEVILVLTM